MTALSLTLRTPDDWHLHLRDGELLRLVLPCSARHFGRAIIMPNTVPPIVTTADAQAYLSRILDAVPAGCRFEPLMTLYMTERTDPDDVQAGAEAHLVRAVKLYPAGATTNSDSGVTDFEEIYPVLERMEEIGLPLLVHGEVNDPEIDIFDREAVFLDRVLSPIVNRFKELKLVLEHVTTGDGVDFVRNSGSRVAGTITPHHLMINRNDLLAGGIRPHYYCLPVVKRETHRLALREAAVSGDGNFFLGTDSAPHPDSAKEAACGCAGVFNAPVTLSCLAQVFEEEGALDRLEMFTSLNGPNFYGLEPNETKITLQKSDSAVTGKKIDFTEQDGLTVFDPGVPLFWKVASTAAAASGA